MKDYHTIPAALIFSKDLSVKFLTLHLAAIIFILFFSTLSLQAQQTEAQNTVKGSVTSSADGEPLPGVNIAIKGSNTGTITDIDGNYLISVNPSDTLVFSFIGYTTQEILVGQQTTVNVILEEDYLLINEVVVVGYGTLRRSDLTGAVSSVGEEEMTQVSLADPVQALQGRVAGMQVLNSSGDPGSAPIIRLRGITTLNNNNPLFVVDGVIIDVAQESSGSSLDFINSNDIKSVEVLKDASATAIFGARGSNGVIIITTKQGQKGEAKISFSAEEGWESVSHKIELMNSREFATYINDMSPGTFNNLDALANVDWQDEVFNENTSIRNYNLSFSGANESVNYYTSFGYYYQEGVLPKSDLQRVTGRLNLDFQAKEWVKLGVNLNIAHYDKQNAPGVVNTAYRAWPTDEPRDANGNFQEVMGGGNALASIEYSNSSRNTLRTLGNLYAEFKIIEGIKFKSGIQYDGDFTKERSFTPQYYVAPLQQNETSDINKEFRYSYQWVWENTLSFNKVWGVHRVDAVVGYTSQERQNEYIKGHTENLLRNDELFWYLAGGDLTADEATLDNQGKHSAITSMLFRLNYVLSDKYLFTVTGRRDASSNFGRNNRAGFFPSAALGWNIYEENFFPLKDVFNKVKIRASWGVVGNEKIDYLDQYGTIGIGNGAVFNDDLVPGATYTSAGNPDLKWEETEQYNIGAEFSVLNSRLNTEFDYYVKNSSDILVDLNPLGYQGYGAFEKYRANAADVQNKGFEFNVSWQDDIGDFSYQIGFNGSTVKNEVTGLGDIGADSVIVAGDLGNGQQVTRTVVGQPIGFFYGYEIVGVFQNADQVANTPSLVDQSVGDFIYADNNGDGVINDNDKIYLGSPIPDFIYGINGEVGYKGVKLGFNFQGQMGNKIYNGKATIRFAQLNYEKRFTEHWTVSNPTNEHPKASAGGSNFFPSRYYIEDGSFLRLRTLTLSYDFPKRLLNKAKLNTARVYVRANNLFTITDFSGYSPDIGSSALDGVIDMGRYPQTCIYSVGMNLSL